MFIVKEKSPRVYFIITIIIINQQTRALLEMSPKKFEEKSAICREIILQSVKASFESCIKASRPYKIPMRKRICLMNWKQLPAGDYKRT